MNINQRRKLMLTFTIMDACGFEDEIQAFCEDRVKDSEKTDKDTLWNAVDKLVTEWLAKEAPETTHINPSIQIDTGLIDDADTSYEDAHDWYNAYGWHWSTEHHGDVSLQAVEYDWLDDDDDDAVIAKLMVEYPDLLEDEAASIVEKARDIRDTGIQIESLLSDAVEAYERGDEDAVIYALDRANEIENEHGDAPASLSLRHQLLR
jgi:hypothetical protein